MAGLPCEVCQEAMTVIPSGAVVVDAAGRTVYRRYRACTNPACEMYLIRRETFEVAAPLGDGVKVLPADMHNLHRLHLEPRTPEQMKEGA